MFMFLAMRLYGFDYGICGWVIFLCVYCIMPKQHGAGILDFMVSDPKKRIEMNNKKIEEIKKESETKCSEIQKANDAKIKKLEDDNTKLEAQVEAKANEGPSIMSRFKNLFSSDEAKPTGEVKVEENPMNKEKPLVEEQDKPVVEENDEEVKPMVKPMDQEKPVGDRNMFGGKKNKKSKKRKQKSNRRKSSKK
jgi:hypothetical protein